MFLFWVDKTMRAQIVNRSTIDRIFIIIITTLHLYFNSIKNSISMCRSFIHIKWSLTINGELI